MDKCITERAERETEVIEAIDDLLNEAITIAEECYVDLDFDPSQADYLAILLVERRAKAVLTGSPAAEKFVPSMRGRPPISHNLRRRVFERDAYRCLNCGDWRDLCADHIVPLSGGGPTTFDNLQTLCRSCNSRKGQKV